MLFIYLLNKYALALNRYVKALHQKPRGFRDGYADALHQMMCSLSL